MNCISYKRKKRKKYSINNIWSKAKEHKYQIGAFVIIILFAVLIVIFVDLAWIIKISGGDTDIDIIPEEPPIYIGRIEETTNTNWNNGTDFTKIITYLCEYNISWVDVEFILIWFTITINQTINNTYYVNESIQLYNIADQQWDAINSFTITESESFYFERDGREYLTKDDEDETQFRLRILTSNIGSDYVLTTSLTIK